MGRQGKRDKSRRKVKTKKRGRQHKGGCEGKRGRRERKRCRNGEGEVEGKRKTGTRDKREKRGKAQRDGEKT